MLKMVERAAQELRDARYMLTRLELLNFAELMAVKVRGDDLPAVAVSSFQQLVDRHAVLRELVPLASGDDEDKGFLLMRLALLRGAVEVNEARNEA